jgi:hypothetical protein
LTRPAGLILLRSLLHQYARKLVHHHPRVRHSPRVPGVSGIRVADSEVAVEGSEQNTRKPATIAPLAAKQEPSAVLASPDAVVDLATTDEG